MFLNNVSLGAYADVVAEPGYRARKLAPAPTGSRRPWCGAERARLAVEFTDPDGRRHEGVLVLLVANNKYQLQRASELGARDRLDEGAAGVGPCGQGPERRWPGSSPRPPLAGSAGALPGRSGRPPRWR